MFRPQKGLLQLQKRVQNKSKFTAVMFASIYTYLALCRGSKPRKTLAVERLALFQKRCIPSCAPPPPQPVVGHNGAMCDKLASASHRAL